MINLLPPEEKENIVFARHNTQLRRWIAGAGCGLAGVFLVVLGGQVYLQQTTRSYEASIKASKQNLTDQKQTETLQRVKSIQDSLTLVVDVLSREVLFSKLLPQVGQIMPRGTVLEDLSLSTDGSTRTAFNLTARAKDYQSASQIVANLTDPANKLFEKVDLNNITLQPKDENDQYPYQASLRVLPSKDNPFLLLSKEAKP